MVTKNIDEINKVRESHKKVAGISYGTEAWITKAWWGYGVRFYPVNTGYEGMIETVKDGDIELVERL